MDSMEVKRQKTTESPSVGWRNRIIGEAMVEPALLLSNPSNWRKHPEAQRRALTRVLDTIGWVGRVLVNKRTDHIVDGHLRVELAAKRGEAVVPVLYVDLTELEESKILALLDPIGDMAQASPEALLALIAEVPKVDELHDLVKEIAERYAYIPRGDGPKPTAHGLTNAKFQHKLEFDDAGQLERFHAFLRKLAKEHPENTVGGRIDCFLAERTEI